jgi:hypothetical protein
VVPITSSEAIARANAAEPAPLASIESCAPEGISVGATVSVAPLDENSPAHGVLGYVDDQRIVIAVSDERVRKVHVHFPRSGYKLSRWRFD